MATGGSQIQPVQAIATYNSIVQKSCWKTLDELAGPQFFSSLELATRFSTTAPQRPHENPTLAELGVKQYLHVDTFYFSVSKTVADSMASAALTETVAASENFLIQE
jgi:hypothetical protein